MDYYDRISVFSNLEQGCPKGLWDDGNIFICNNTAVPSHMWLLST